MELKQRLQKAHLYGIIDRRFEKREEFAQLIPLLAQAGVDIIQLREKRIGKKRVRDEAKRLNDLCQKNGILFVVNDYPDIASELDCDGVHISQKDCTIAQARRIVGEDKICLLYTSPSPRDLSTSRMPSSA